MDDSWEVDFYYDCNWFRAERPSVALDDGVDFRAFVSLGILACNFSALWAFAGLASFYFLDFGSASAPASGGRLLLYYGHVIGIGVGLF